MQILKSQDVRSQPTDMRFGPSKIKVFVVFLVVVGLWAIPLVVIFNDRQWTPLVFVSFIGVIILLVMCSWVFKAFKKDGWRLAVQNNAILMKVDIGGKGDGQDILEVKFNEIVSLRKIRERYILYKGGRNPTKPVRIDALDIQLTSDSFDQLESILGLTTAGLEMVMPCQLIYPIGTSMLNTNAIISQLKNHCRTLRSELICYDMPSLKDPQEVNSYILFLIRRGHCMDAQKLASDAFGLGVRKSKDYIEMLFDK